MQVKRFVAADMRRALELVRNELGADAVILSSKRVKQGVEILTTVASDDSVPTQQPLSVADSLFGRAAPHKQGKSARDIAEEIEIAARRRTAVRMAEASADEFLRKDQVVNAGIERRRQVEAGKPSQPQSAAERYGLMDAVPARDSASVTAPASTAGHADISQLQEELAEMRLLLEEQLSRLGATPPGAKTQTSGSVQRRFERMGFSSAVASAIAPADRRTIAKAWPAAMATLAHRLPVAEADVTAKGGIFALVGPTGVGKTTTIAKLAARYVLEHGADKVALVTTDTQKIAGHDQLKSIGAILKVPVRVVDTNNPLDHVLRALRGCKLILIDTAGMRHGDPALKMQLTQLARIRKIQSYLVLASNSQTQMLKASVHAYREANLKGCILTKLDETESLGESLGVAMQARLPIAYTTDGQNVPVDIAVPRGHQLVTRAAALAQQQVVRERARGER